MQLVYKMAAKSLISLALSAGLAYLARREDRYLRRPPRKDLNREAKKLREELSPRQVDKMIDDSFPASDPPSTY